MVKYFDNDSVNEAIIAKNSFHRNQSSDVASNLNSQDMNRVYNTRSTQNIRHNNTIMHQGVKQHYQNTVEAKKNQNDHVHVKLTNETKAKNTKFDNLRGNMSYEHSQRNNYLLNMMSYKDIKFRNLNSNKPIPMDSGSVSTSVRVVPVWKP
jgi:hypothetical protein